MSTLVSRVEMTVLKRLESAKAIAAQVFNNPSHDDIMHIYQALVEEEVAVSTMYDDYGKSS